MCLTVLFHNLSLVLFGLTLGLGPSTSFILYTFLVFATHVDTMWRRGVVVSGVRQ